MVGVSLYSDSSDRPTTSGLSDVRDDCGLGLADGVLTADWYDGIAANLTSSNLSSHTSMNALSNVEIVYEMRQPPLE